MQDTSTLKESTLNSLNDIFKTSMEAIPNIIGAILVLIIDWFITKIIIYLLRKLLKVTHVEKLTSLFNDKKIFGSAKLKFDIGNVIVTLVKIILYLVILIVVSDILNWTVISAEIGNLLRYLPKLISAVVIFTIGLYIANLIRTAIKGLFDSFDLIGGQAGKQYRLLYYGCISYDYSLEPGRYRYRNNY